MTEPKSHRRECQKGGNEPELTCPPDCECDCHFWCVCGNPTEPGIFHHKEAACLVF